MFGWVKILPHSEILDKIQATDFKKKNACKTIFTKSFKEAVQRLHLLKTER